MNQNKQGERERERERERRAAIVSNTSTSVFSAVHHSHPPPPKKEQKKRSGESRYPQKPLIMLWNVMIVSWLEQNGLCVRALHLTTMMKRNVRFFVCVCVFSDFIIAFCSHTPFYQMDVRWKVLWEGGGSPGEDCVSPHWLCWLTMYWRNWLKPARSNQQLSGVTNGHKRTRIAGKNVNRRFYLLRKTNVCDM